MAVALLKAKPLCWWDSDDRTATLLYLKTSQAKKAWTILTARHRNLESLVHPLQGFPDIHDELRKFMAGASKILRINFHPCYTYSHQRGEQTRLHSTMRVRARHFISGREKNPGHLKVVEPN